METSSVLILAIAGVILKELISTFWGNRDRNSKAQYEKLIKGCDTILKQVTTNAEQVKAAQNALISITQNQVTEARSSAECQVKITEIHTATAKIAKLEADTRTLRASVYETLELSKELLTMHKKVDNDGIEVWYSAPYYTIHEKSIAALKECIKDLDGKVEQIERQVAILTQQYRKSKK